MSPDFANGPITGAFAYAAEMCAAGGCEDNASTNQLSNGNNASTSPQQNQTGVPDRLVILNPQGENEGSYSNYYYQVQDANGNPITSDISLAEEVTPANANTPPSNNSNGEFFPIQNGQFLDQVGWVNVAPPQDNVDWTYNQTFLVQSSQGQIYPLTTKLQHENITNNGVVTNLDKVIKP